MLSDIGNAMREYVQYQLSVPTIKKGTLIKFREDFILSLPESYGHLLPEYRNAIFKIIKVSHSKKKFYLEGMKTPYDFGNIDAFENYFPNRTV